MPRRALVLAVLAVLTLAVANPARADTSEDKKRQVAQIADRIEQLGDRAAQLGQAINGAEIALQQADTAVNESQKKLTELETRLSETRSSMANFALHSYIYADQTAGVAALLAGTSVSDGAAQREGYAKVAMGGAIDITDDLGALIEDANRERQVLADRKGAREKALQAVTSSKAAAEKALAKQQDLLVKTKGELATLLQQEQQRRAEAAAAASRSAAQAAIQAQQQAAAAKSALGANRPATPAPTTSGSPGPAPRPAPPAARPEPSIPDVPPTSPGAAIAVRAALSQLGVPYRFATAEPGVSFDCSGLTMWAWAQAGVSMGHFTVTQYNSFPHVPFDQLQPGDIVFFYADLGHNGLYIGNGQFVHAPRTGDVVKISPLAGRNFAGAVRPG
jgi:cell wall-associated NlpC family hydrolase